MSLVFAIIFLGVSLFIWLDRDRSYQSKVSVANAYDDWTNDHLLEQLWGEHIHLGYYRKFSKEQDFRRAKIDFVHELIKWSGLDKLPKGSKIIDIGCGIGGSARILAQDYGFKVIGVSISTAQIQRAKELTPADVPCQFDVMDALNLTFSDETFDAVWSVEAGPHMPDKQKYADEMLRVLKPSGLFAIADWNCRDHLSQPMNFLEKIVMRQLLRQWAHPKFASIIGFKNNLLNSSFSTSNVEASDWTKYTLPSWNDSILEGIRRPGVFTELGLNGFIKGAREIPTILLMRWAFANGLMKFGVFRTIK